MNIPIFLASDENYAKYMAVTMTSIFTNTEEFIEFYILDGGIEEETKKKIEDLKNIKSNFSIEFITVDMSLFENFPNLGHFSLNTYLRYLIPDLKPELDKVLYLDVDLVVNGDISEFYNIDLEGYPIGAIPYLIEGNVEYVDWCNGLKQTIGMNRESVYFNAGVLVIDCDYFRKHNMQKYLFDKTSEMANILLCPDQDVLNVTFENNYKILPANYNLVIDMTDKNIFDKYKNIFYILHYTGGKGYRPWLNSECPFAEDFWKLAKQTPFYNEMINDLKHYDIAKNRKNKLLKLQYHLYKMINVLTFKNLKFIDNKAVELRKLIKGR